MLLMKYKVLLMRVLGLRNILTPDIPEDTLIVLSIWLDVKF